MKTLTRLVLASGLLTAASGAFAHEDCSEKSATHWCGHVAAFSSQPTEQQLARYGYASSAMPTREVIIDKVKRHINVVRLETVAIRMAEKTANWTFDTFGTASFSLAKAIPGTEGVTVYVDENPMYQGGR
ncbi:CzcE family metal-binding protein [Aromatoleum evansii]|uniref:CzcE family metal-binding protein n=1 Tax=Aromatoleum evansii TaxID=59406 RepID=UPI00145EAA91|nr:CzcE family metal-binding protein [Aromatoleum evansii]NMG29961.1 CzcE family metal-binding protein [Aromatoleum evansii]